jgi:hypothetical protein
MWFLNLIHFFPRRFHWAPPLTDTIATAILENETFHTEFLEGSKRALGEHRRLAASAFDDARVPYVQNA